MIERIEALISKSFSRSDLDVLPTVLNASIDTNIRRIELIIDHLNKIKRAMVQGGSTRDDPQKNCA